MIEVGYSSVLGAERILAGQDLYGAEEYRHPELHPDSYGPVTYLLYAPFEGGSIRAELRRSRSGRSL